MGEQEHGLIDTNEVARLARRSTRWVHYAVRDGRLTAAKRVRGEFNGTLSRFLFDPITIARQLAELGLTTGLREKVCLFILGLCRRDRAMAEAMWLVMFEDRSVVDAARMTGINEGPLRSTLARNRVEIERFVREVAGGEPDGQRTDGQMAR